MRAGLTASLFLLGIVWSALPAAAEMDFSGDWAPRFFEDQPERVPGPELGDYLGLPVNDAARMRADTWSASLLTEPEWQCRPHGADYIWRGPSNLRIWKEVDPSSREIVAWHAEWLRSVDRPVYMDGRPHPPDWAPHTWAGFSTGKYEGDVLTTYVTHLKESYIRRNGMARSEKATVTEHWIRHGDWLTVVTIVNDPVYLTEPFVRSTDYQLDLHQHVPPYPCDSVTEVERAKGVVPNVLPGANAAINDFCRPLRRAARSRARRGGNHVPGISQEAEGGRGKAGGAGTLADESARIDGGGGRDRGGPNEFGSPYFPRARQHLYVGGRGREHHGFGGA